MATDNAPMHFVLPPNMGEATEGTLTYISRR